MRKWLLLLALCSGLLPASAGLNVSVQIDRGSYLLYEPIYAKVNLFNNTDQDLTFGGDPTVTTPWLSFLVTDTNRNGSAIRPDVASQFPSISMRAGEKRTVAVNITPLYSIREAGEFKIAAIVDLPGQAQVVSGNTTFSIYNGQTLWHASRPINGSERTYSLLRFSPSGVGTYIYLRVEDVKENIVYTTAPVGELADAIPPTVVFDPEGGMNILHICGQATWHYARFDPDGKLLAQNDFTSLQDAPPQLVSLANGAVVVRGGVARANDKPRETLSDAMTQKRPAEAPPAIATAAPAPPASTLSAPTRPRMPMR